MSVKDYYEHYWSVQGFNPRGNLPSELAATLSAELSPGWCVLDVGCGDGRSAGVWLREHSCEYTGVDVSAGAIRQCQAFGLDARLIQDASSLPFADNHFDAAVCVEVLEHLFSPHLVATEILRVLKPGGLIVVTVPNVSYWRRRVDLALLGRWNPLGDDLAVSQPWRDPHLRFFNPESLGRMLRLSGFVRVQVSGVGGSVLRDLPWVGKRWWNSRSSSLYRILERRAPTLLGYRVQAVAHKPKLIRDSKPPTCL